MTYAQLITPNPVIPCEPGWCLAYVNEAYRVPKRFPTAISAWNASQTKHRDYDFPPNVWVPLWFSLKHEPAGHVVLRAPDGAVWSTSHPTLRTPTRHPNLAHLIYTYSFNNPLTYLGWTEDVEGTPVITPGLAGLSSIIEIEDEEMKEADFARIRAEIDASLVTMLDPKHDRRAGDGLSWSTWFERGIPGFNGDVSAAARLAGIDHAVSVIIPSLVAELRRVNTGQPFDETRLLETITRVIEAKSIEVTIK